MKKIILVLYFLPFFSISQINFKKEENKIIWQKVFLETTTPEIAESNLLKSAVFSDVFVNDKEIIANFTDFKIDYEAAGYRYRELPMYISRMMLKGTAIIEFKEDKYRVTLKNLEITPLESGLLGEAGVYEDFSYIAIKKRNQEYRTHFIDIAEPIYTKEFTKLFTFKETKTDW